MVGHKSQRGGRLYNIRIYTRTTHPVRQRLLHVTHGVCSARSFVAACLLSGGITSSERCISRGMEEINKISITVCGDGGCGMSHLQLDVYNATVVARTKRAMYAIC